jgi:hypothetical protein
MSIIELVYILLVKFACLASKIGANQFEAQGNSTLPTTTTSSSNSSANNIHKDLAKYDNSNILSPDWLHHSSANLVVPSSPSVTKSPSRRPEHRQGIKSRLAKYYNGLPVSSGWFS